MLSIKDELLGGEPILSFALKAGAAAVIALFLVYRLSFKVEDVVADTNAKVGVHAEMTAGYQVNVTNALNSLVNISVQNCVNAAATRDERAACVRAMTTRPVLRPEGQP
jgi:hypothetical protein